MFPLFAFFACSWPQDPPPDPPPPTMAVDRSTESVDVEVVRVNADGSETITGLASDQSEAELVVLQAAGSVSWAVVRRSLEKRDPERVVIQTASAENDPEWVIRVVRASWTLGTTFELDSSLTWRDPVGEVTAADEQALRAHMPQSMRKVRPHLRIVGVSPDPDATWSDVVHLLDLALEAGARHIRLHLDPPAAKRSAEDGNRPK